MNVVTFQRFDPKWNKMVDLDEEAVVNDKDKLKALVTPILVTPPVTSPDESCLEVSMHAGTTHTLPLSFNNLQ